MLLIKDHTAPFFSVVICTYNRAYLLADALNSLLEQVETDWEAIIVDDGSSDDTYALAKSFVDKDDRFRYIHHQNKGLPLSRNVGILASAGLFVTFLDSDDKYLPEHLSIRRQALEENPDVELLYGGVEVIGDSLVPDKNNPGKTIDIKDCVVGGTFFIKKETCIELDGFKNLDFGDDADFYDRAVAECITVAQIDVPTYVYNRTVPDSICNKLKNNI